MQNLTIKLLVRVPVFLQTRLKSRIQLYFTYLTSKTMRANPILTYRKSPREPGFLGQIAAHDVVRTQAGASKGPSGLGNRGAPRLPTSTFFSLPPFPSVVRFVCRCNNHWSRKSKKKKKRNAKPISFSAKRNFGLRRKSVRSSKLCPLGEIVLKAKIAFQKVLGEIHFTQDLVWVKLARHNVHTKHEFPAKLV